MRIITYINLHKSLVTPLVVGLMAFYANWSMEAFVYLSLHGAYSMLWLMKEAMYPDARFEQQVPFRIGVTPSFPAARELLLSAVSAHQPARLARALGRRVGNRCLHLWDLLPLRQRCAEVLHA